ncbi:MAG: glucose-1-phosphate thymidylyltransferase [Patescibacteria group bacterium]
MKALLAAGGRSTRMRPITHTINKQLIPLANRPMLEYPIRKLVEAGITDILININPGERDVMRAVFGDGERYGATLTYIEQEGGARGIAHAVANAEPHLRGGPFVFFLGDNIMVGSIRKLRERYEMEGFDCLIGLSRVKDPNRYGVAEFNPDGTLKRAVEKPTDPPSPFAITGIYFFNDKFFDGFKTMQPSARGEYEITDMITWYIENGRVGHEEITGWWKDTGTPDALLEGNALMLDEMRVEEMVNRGTIAEGSVIQGKVRIEEGTIIDENVLIRGPVVIGSGCRISDAYVGPYTSIGDGVELHNTEIEHSIVMERATIQSGKRIVDSIIGRHASITSNQETLPRGHKLIIGDHASVEL